SISRVGSCGEAYSQMRKRVRPLSKGRPSFVRWPKRLLQFPFHFSLGAHRFHPVLRDLPRELPVEVRLSVVSWATGWREPVRSRPESAERQRCHRCLRYHDQIFFDGIPTPLTHPKQLDKEHVLPVAADHWPLK